MGLEKNNTGVTFYLIIYQGCILSMWYHFLCWPWSPTKVIFIWFLHSFHSSFPFCTLWKEVTMYSSYLNSGSYAPPPWERQYLPKLFGIFIYRRFVISFHVFIYPMIYSYLYGFMDIIYTHTYALGYNSVQCYLFFAQVFSNFGHFNWLVSLWHSPHFVCWALPYVLTL